MTSFHQAIMSTPPHQHGSGELKMLWRTKEGSDITIRCGDSIEVQAHRAVLARFPWMGCVFDLQRTMHSDSRYIQLQERASVIRPLLAFCYGVELPPLQRGPKSEDQLRDLIDLYHINESKYHIPKLNAVCEAALADLGDSVNIATPQTGKTGKSPMHGVVTRMLASDEEGRASLIEDSLTMTGLWTPRPSDVHDATPINKRYERRGRAFSEASTLSDTKGKFLTSAHDSLNSDNDRDRQGITIPGSPRMARLRDRSPGGTPYSSPRLYNDILAMLGPPGLPSPMLDQDFPIARPDDNPFSPLRFSTSSLEDLGNLPEDTLQLIPSPLRPLTTKKTKGSGLFGPRPQPIGNFSKRNVMAQDMHPQTLKERPSLAAIKDGMFSSLRGATRRAFSNNKSKN
ncbi:hypothetical protein IWZ01DRAFT_485271 [Phyllosticta capitalensis]